MYRLVDPKLNYEREAIVELACRYSHVSNILDIAAGSGRDLTLHRTRLILAETTSRT